MDDPFDDAYQAPAAAAKKPAAAAAKPKATTPKPQPPAAAPAPPQPSPKPAAAAKSTSVLSDPFDESPAAAAPAPAAAAKAKKPKTPEPAPPTPVLVDEITKSLAETPAPSASSTSNKSDSLFDNIPDAVNPPPAITTSSPTADSPTDDDTSSSSSSSSSAPTTTTTAAAAATSSSLSDLASSYVDLDEEETSPDELSLEDAGLSTFPEDVMRTKGNNLKKIDLTSNKFTSLKSFTWSFGAPAWPNLTELILDKNQLESLSGCSQIPSLTTLWMNNNKISDLDTLLDQIEKLFPHLTYLSMMRNPACPDMYFSDGEMESYGRYRLYVIYRLKNLQALDSSPVTPEERKEATLRGAYCRVAKPQATKVTSKKEENPTSAMAEAGIIPVVRQSQVGLDKTAKPPKVATFLAKGKPRYDGTNSEGNRFIMNDDL